MSNHFHLMVKTGTGSLSDIMRSVLTGYAIYFNKKYKRHGYLYQNRYKSVLCQEDMYFKGLVRYIHLNPLRAGIVSKLSDLSRHVWSGHRAIIGKCQIRWQDVEGVLVMFGQKQDVARRKYLDFIGEGQKENPDIDFCGGGLIRSAGGWRNVVSLRGKKCKQRHDERILGGNDFVDKVLQQTRENRYRHDILKEQGWDLDRLAQRVCDLYDLSVADLKRRGKNNSISNAKKLFCYWGSKELRVSGRDLAEYLEISRPSVCFNITSGAQIDGHKLII